MRLKSLGCKYFMHFGSWQEIHFNEDQSIVSIIGEWANEPKRSNRSGKSTFVEMIMYALYGKSRSKKEVDLINKFYPEEDMVVELTFDNNIVIQRGRTSTNQIILELTGFEGADKKVIQDEINKIVGLSYEDFIMTSFFIQGDIHTFMEAGATGQKQIIAKWLEKDYWKIYEKKAKEKQSEIQKEIDRLQYIADDRPDLSRDEIIKSNIIQLENNKNEIETQLETLSDQLEGINGEINKANEVTEIEKTIKSLKSEIKTFKGYIEEEKESIENRKSMIEGAKKRAKYIAKEPEILEQFNKQKSLFKEAESIQDEIRDEISQLKAKKDSLKNQYENMKNFNNICPVMQKPCSAIDEVKDTRTEVVQRGKDLNARIKKAQEKYQEGKLHVEGFKETLEEINSNLATIKRYKADYSVEEIELIISKHEARLKKYQSDMQGKVTLLEASEQKLEELENIDISELKSQRTKIKSQIADNKSEHADIINNIGMLTAQLNQLKDKRKQAIKAAKEIKIVTEKLNHYRLVTFMFGKNGIPSNQIETAFNEIEEEANIILEKINSDMSIQFSPDKEMKSWEENCLVCGNPFPKGFRKIECPECDAERQKKRKDELSIKIFTKGEEMDFNLESGGGKVLISLAIRLAFVRMLQRRMGVNLKLIVFDEIFGMLDETNRELVFKLLAGTLINDFGFDQLFAISHESEIRDVIPDMIKITKFDEYSNFEWV
jgi:DNA repair exonuclease SbcCD ATPase subunit